MTPREIMAAMEPPTPRSVIDSMRCAGCEEHEDHDGPLFLHASCHLSAQTVVCYENGRLLVSCGECSRPIVMLEIA